MGGGGVTFPPDRLTNSSSPAPLRQINGFYNDLALFRLSRPVELNEYVVPVCLPVEYEDRPLDSLVGQTPSVIGWGTTFYGTYKQELFHN